MSGHLKHRSHVPEPWAELMIDPEATIIDFYPEDFKIDLNGKKFAWQGVALLPFVDEVGQLLFRIRSHDPLYIRPHNCE
jgi:5'-3' exonuclease